MRSTKQLSIIYGNMAQLLKAGIPILRTLDIVTEQEKGFYQRVLQRIRHSVTQGMGIAESMASERRMFSDFERCLIRTGETSGTLDECFTLLSEWCIRCKTR